MNKNAGFTLIEILIAMLVLSIGLLGMAGLQAASLKNNISSYKRSQATLLVYDLADRMRANVQGRATYSAIPPIAAAPQANCLTTVGCTVAQMAQNDLFEWNAAITSIFPSGTGTIAVDASGTFTVNITWDDDQDGDASNNANFQTSFGL